MTQSLTDQVCLCVWSHVAVLVVDNGTMGTKLGATGVCEGAYIVFSILDPLLFFLSRIHCLSIHLVCLSLFLLLLLQPLQIKELP